MRSLLNPSEIGVFDPDDLARMQTVFEDALHTTGIEKSSPAAADLARRILAFYRQGIHDPAKLAFMLPIPSPPRKPR